MSSISLTPAQQAVLAHAIGHTEGRIEWFPDNIKGGARQKVLDGLARRGLAKLARKQWLVTNAGRTAAGVHALKSTPADPELEAAVTAAEASFAPPAAPRTRAHSKQAEVVRMLESPEGATVRQICDATGWQPHTVRGAFAGAFKKKLGLALVSDKQPGGERIYRVA
jgi:hypothetical protein